MKNSKFCHLHLHTDKGSLLDGVGQVKQYIKKAKKMGFEYLGISDHGSIDAVLDFENAAKEAGLKTIIGCELYVSNDDGWKGKRKHMCVFVKNETGWKNLTKMLSQANLETFYRKPIVELGTVYDNCEGLVITSACVGSWLYLDSGIDFLDAIHNKIGDDLYLEIMPHNHPLQYETNEYCLKLAKERGIELITTCDVHYVDKNDAVLQDVLLAVNSRRKWNDPNRFSLDFRDLYLMSANKALSMYSEQDIIDVKTAKRSIKNTLKIAKKCENFIIPRQEISLPEVKKYPNLSVKKNIEKICRENYRKIFKEPIRKNKVYNDRVQEETRVISNKNFSNYFTVVWDFINKCREQGIPVGPGRGSVSGSLICYLMGITKVNPIEHNLLFERFLNEDRGDWPDIDIDVGHVRREDAKNILEETYGKYNIAGVTNFVSMKGKTALRDVSRVFDVPLDIVNALSKEITDDISLKNALEDSEVGKHFKRNYSKVVDIALRLEGTIRGASQHAAAIIVSKYDLRHSGQCNLVRRDGKILINWEMKNSEEVGLMKLDVLSLSNLSVIEEAKRLIQETHNVKLTDSELIGLNDPEVYKCLPVGDTSGIFQFNTYSMTKLAQDLYVDNFNLMTVAQALVRPGPADSGVTEEFIKRRHGKKWEPGHPIYEKITSETLGLICFQEEVMQMFTEMAGLSFKVADKIRKIIGKKRDVSEFEQYRQMFIDGCEKMGTLDKKGADDFWKILEANANYGFNKCLTGKEKVILSNNELTSIDSLKNKLRSCESVLLKTYDLKTNSIIDDKCIEVIDSGIQQVFEIELSNGKTIECTSEHKFLCSDFKMHTVKEIIASSLDIINIDNFLLKILSIKNIGKKRVYNLTMEGENHNYLLESGVVSANSHAVGYSYISYETAYLKKYYPIEFFCASLTFSDKEKKKNILIECSKQGIEYSLPKIGISKADRWINNNGILLAPFTEIIGFGEKDSKKAEELKTGSIKTNSFFVVKEKIKGQTKFDHILRTVNAYDDREVDKDIQQYFDIPISMDYSITHPKLIEFVGKKFSEKDLKKIEIGKKYARRVIGPTKTKENVFNCDYCKDEYPDPIFMENGKISGMVVLDRPTRNDFESNDSGFFENSTLNRFKKNLKNGGIDLDKFYMSYLVKCFEEEKSDESEIKCSACLERDVKYAKPNFIISIGSGPARIFCGESVMKMSGSVLWNEKYGCFIYYLMSPFMGKKEDFASKFKEDIENLKYYYKNWRLK